MKPTGEVARRQRLMQERERMEMLVACSSSLTLASVEGDPPTVYVLAFALESEAWRGLPDLVRPPSPVLFRVELPEAFPQTPPSLRCCSRFWHPNIAEDGGTPWRSLQLVWNRQRSLEDVAARLWEIVTWRRFEVTAPRHQLAARWFQTHVRPPILDPRALRDLAEPGASVVFSYRRTSAGLEVTPLRGDRDPCRNDGMGESDQGASSDATPPSIRWGRVESQPLPDAGVANTLETEDSLGIQFLDAGGSGEPSQPEPPTERSAD